MPKAVKELYWHLSASVRSLEDCLNRMYTLLFLRDNCLRFHPFRFTVLLSILFLHLPVFSFLLFLFVLEFRSFSAVTDNTAVIKKTGMSFKCYHYFWFLSLTKLWLSGKQLSVLLGL